MPSLKKIKGRYYLYVYDATRSPRQKCIALGTNRKDVAKKRAANHERRMADGDFDPWAPRMAAPVDEAPLSVEAASAAFLKAKSTLRPPSQKAYRLAMEGVLQTLPLGLPLDDLTLSHLRPYLEARDVAAETRRHRFRHVRVFIRWALERDYLAADPMRGLRLPKAGKKAPVFLSHKDFSDLLSKMEAGGAGWLADVTRFAVCTGLRAGELCSLRVDSVDLSPGMEAVAVRNDARFETKNGHDHRVPLVLDALEVARQRTAGRGASEALFTLDGERPLKPGTLSHAFKRYVRKAGVDDKVHLHSLRHTCASWMLQRGLDLFSVSKVLGHSSIQPTQIYAHLTTESLRGPMSRGLSRGKGRLSSRRRVLRRAG